MLAIKDNVLRASRLITIPWNDDCNFSYRDIRVLVAAPISGRVKLEGYPALLLRRHISSQLMCLFIELNCWMVAIQHVLECLHSSMVQVGIPCIPHTIVEGILRGIDIELSIDRGSIWVFWWQ